MSPLQHTNSEADDQMSLTHDFERNLALFDKVSGFGAPPSQPPATSEVADLLADPTPATKLTEKATGFSGKGVSSSPSMETSRSLPATSPRQSATTKKISPSGDSPKKDRLPKNSSVSSSPLPSSVKPSGNFGSMPAKSTSSSQTSSTSSKNLPKVAVKANTKKKSNEQKNGEIDYQAKVLTTFAAMILGGILLGFGGWAVYEISLPANLPFWEQTFKEEIDTCKEFIVQKFPTIFDPNKSEKKETQQGDENR